MLRRVLARNDEGDPSIEAGVGERLRRVRVQSGLGGPDQTRGSNSLPVLDHGVKFFDHGINFFEVFAASFLRFDI
jgi:hypothetical protein